MEGNSTDIRTFDDSLILVSKSVWESVEALHEYTYQSQHAEVYRRRKIITITDQL